MSPATATPDVLTEKLAVVKLAVKRAHPRVPESDIAVAREGDRLVARVPEYVAWVATVGLYAVSLQRVDPTSLIPLDGEPEVVPIPVPVAPPPPQDPAELPALLVRTVVVATERLQHAVMVARSVLGDVADTVDEEVRRVLSEARGDRAKLPDVAARAEEAYANVVAAAQGARDAERAAAAAEARLAGHLKAAEASVLLRDADRVRVLKLWLKDLVTPLGDLAVALTEVPLFLPAFEAAVTRRTHACLLVARRLFVDEVTEQLAGLRHEVERVQARRTAPDPVEAALAPLRARVEARSGALAVPTVIWPPDARGPFHGPKLKD